MFRTLTTSRPARLLAAAGVLGLLAAGCTSNTPRDPPRPPRAPRPAPSATTTPPARRSPSASPAPRPTTAGSPPSTTPRRRRPRSTRDIDFKMAEGTNDASQQISQIETFINDKVDAIVLLPTDGAALTEVATKAMQAGITVVNVDREFSSPFAARTTVLGDNYGMGVSAGTYACKLDRGQEAHQPGDRRDRRHRLAAADPGPQQGLRRRAQGVRPDRRQPGRRRVHRRVR